MNLKPIYLDSNISNKFEKKLLKLNKILEKCEFCPRKCWVNRRLGEKGYCKMGKKAVISSFGPHFGEETVLVGSHGSGTIFLAGCNLLCVYCQNYEISHFKKGVELSSDKIADLMLNLQKKGCHNINFVTPTHFTSQLVKSIKIGVEKGVRLPIVWNCSGYENVKIIKLLDGIVDIYMPDIKYGKIGPAKKYSNAPDYFERCKESVKEMFRQVGDLKLESGIAYRGLIIRHLILPQNLVGTVEVLKFIKNLSKNTYINLMDQFRPEGKAFEFEEISRPINRKEFLSAINKAKKFGLNRLDKITYYN
jgi:putative pyruvate formate lyase activating enzyme